MADKETKKDVLESDKPRKARVTFSGNKLPEIQMVTKNLVENSKKYNASIRGPVRLPNKHLRICCRRSPCGEGTKTWDNFEMTVYKRYIDIICTTTQIKDITMFQIPSTIHINIDFTEERT
jgi:small subunit ribosomal protein S20e